MLKTISAALLAVSVIAAPALAADSAKTAKVPAAKTVQAPVAKTSNAKTADIKAASAKPGVMNANAEMGRHHAKHHRHHRHHEKMGVIKTHSKVGFKQAAPATKRG
jgi:hypothetical protein